MIINGELLLAETPVQPMMCSKHKKHGVSFGLSEAGYDIRIKQDVWLHPFRRFRLASSVHLFEHFGDIATNLDEFTPLDIDGVGALLDDVFGVP